MTRTLTVPRLAGLRALALVAGLVLSLALVAPASADVEVSDDRTQADDPTSITFLLRVGGDPIESAALNYSVINPDGNVGGALRVSPPSGGTGDLSATLNTITREVYIPVGSQFRYSWTLTTPDGDTVTTDAQEFVFLDGRYTWQSQEQDGVTVYWYSDQDSALQTLQATADSIADVETLLDTELPYPVRVVVWPRESEGELAQRPRGGEFDSQVITGGARVSSDLLHVYDALGSFIDVARHEAAHLVTKVAGDGPFTRVPSWLDEGVAVYAQNDPGDGYRTAVGFAVTTDSPLRLRNMASASNQAAQVNLFYGQSWSTVTYLVDTYGQESLAELFATIKEGNPTDEALMAVYGFDQDGLYNEWRESHGLDAIEYAPRAQG
ncbi:MAG: peptidase MA family metallohydrolase, partial [Dehalococcoidia bacterium]